jgi:uncharacterized protein
MSNCTRPYLFLAATALTLVVAEPVLPAIGPELRLIDAVRLRDHKAFAILLRSKVDINAAEPDGATALAWAVHLGERGMAESLVKAGANPNTTDGYGETPLTLACANGDGVLVQRLLQAGATPGVTRWNGETPLMLAAGAGSMDAVKALVQRGADVNGVEPTRQQTALMWAAAEGHGAVVAGLIELGANVKAVSSTGFTPLLFAVIKGDALSVKALLSAGADPNGATPSGSRPLLVALARNNTAAALALLDAGALTTPVDLMGSSPLHIAAQQGNVAMIDALLARKMDPNILTTAPSPGGQGRGRGAAGGRGGGGARGGGGGARDGGPAAQTPLMLAAKADHEDAMRALVTAGADPAIRAEDGSNLLMAAAAGARLKTFKYAFELDPHVDVVAAASKTIMHAAVVQNGRTQPEVCEVIQFLADHGAALDELDDAGRTPLAAADGLPVDQAVDLLTKLITDRGGKPKIPSKR